jgi:NAD(P)-dependent dehydrogenase (short-subunit alcohol dehydrogenase family)
MNPTTNKSVVITGASSGIGRACVSQMSRAGWKIFATVRKTTDQNRLQSEDPNVTAVLMDVQDSSSITAAAEQISSQLKGRALDGLVNVAGIGIVAPVEYITAEAMQQIFDINVFGQIAVTQAFVPFIRKARGRIVNIISIGAHIAIPFGGLLNASKSAFGLLNDTLRLELRPFGIRVCAIEPGAIKTPAVDKTLGDIESVISNLPQRGAEQYGEMLKNFGQRAYARESHGSAPDVVALAVLHALTASRPRIRYRVGKHAQLLGTLPRILPDRALDAIRMRMLGLPTEFGAMERRGKQKTVVSPSLT